MLHVLFGGPEAVAAKSVLSPGPRALLLSWLRTGEALLRALLVIEAAAYPKPNTRPPLWPRRPRTRHLRTFEPEAPHEWRVCFRCLLDCPRRAKTQVRKRAPAKRFFDSWPLAERYEALLRVYNDPSAAARRLARRLYAEPYRALGIMPTETPLAAESFAALRGAFVAAAVAFDTS
jgi:hypothetical protein